MTVDDLVDGYRNIHKRKRMKDHTKQEERKNKTMTFLSSVGIDVNDKDSIRALLEILIERKEHDGQSNYATIIKVIADAIISLCIVGVGNQVIKNTTAISHFLIIIGVMLAVEITVFTVEYIINLIPTKYDNFIIDLQNILLFPQTSNDEKK